jgi:hypothetical protein
MLVCLHLNTEEEALCTLVLKSVFLNQRTSPAVTGRETSKDVGLQPGASKKREKPSLAEVEPQQQPAQLVPPRNYFMPLMTAGTDDKTVPNPIRQQQRCRDPRCWWVMNYIGRAVA